MHDILSVTTQQTLPPMGRSAFHMPGGERRGANVSELLWGESTEYDPSFLGAIARELSTVPGAMAAEHLHAARRLLTEAFDVVESSFSTPSRASRVRRTLACVQAGR